MRGKGSVIIVDLQLIETAANLSRQLREARFGLTSDPQYVRPVKTGAMVERPAERGRTKSMQHGGDGLSACFCKGTNEGQRQV